VIDGGSEKRFLDVGSGSISNQVPGYLSSWERVRLDVDPQCSPELLLDARQLITQTPGAYDAVYCSHNLEHYHRHEAAEVVRGFAHVLKPEGFVHARVPDLIWVMREVVQRNLDLDDVLYVAADTQYPILVRDVIYGHHVEIEQSGKDFYAHKTGFSRGTFAKLFVENGFPIYTVGVTHVYELTGYFFKTQPGQEVLAMLGLLSG